MRLSLQEPPSTPAAQASSSTDPLPPAPVFAPMNPMLTHDWDAEAHHVDHGHPLPPTVEVWAYHPDHDTLSAPFHIPEGDMPLNVPGGDTHVADSVPVVRT